MKKLHAALLALVALFAFAAIVVNASAAEELLAFWLVNGVAVASALPVLAEGEILLHNTSNGAHIICSFHAEGTINPESLLEITEVLTLGGLAVGALGSEALLCKAVSTCEASTTDIEVRPTNLPWDFEAELVGLAYFLLLKGEASYEIKCLVLGLNFEETCTALAGSGVEQLNLEGGGVEAFGTAKPFAECGGKAEVGENEGLSGNKLVSSEGPIAISSE